MKRNKSVFLIVALFSAAGSVFALEPEQLPSVETPLYQVQQMGKGEPWYDPMKGGRFRFTFKVHNVIEGTENTFVLDNLTSIVHRLRVFREKLLIIGEESTSKASVITVVRLKDGVVDDTLMGFWPKFSRGGRFIVLRKFFSPKNAAPQKRSDLVLLYDLEKSAAENRVRGLDVYRNDPIGRLTETGIPVFPDSNAEKKRYRVWVRDEENRHTILDGGFFWPSGERRIAFIDRVGGRFYFIVIDRGSPGKTPLLHRGEFDPTEDDIPGEKGPPTGRFRLDGVEVLDSGVIQIDLWDRDGEEQTWQFPPDAFAPSLSP